MSVVVGDVNVRTWQGIVLGQSNSVVFQWTAAGQLAGDLRMR
jgi:hypothetical protein